MTLQDLPRAEARQADGPSSARLPWHLRKRFLLPVVVVLVLGAVSSVVLLASAIYTYVQVQRAVAQLQTELSGMGLLGTTEVPTGEDAAALDASGDVGDVGESGWVSYELTGDLDGVEVTWTHMSTGATMSRSASELEWPLNFEVDSTWQNVGLEATRDGAGGEIACAVTDEAGAVLVEDATSGKNASVSCHL